MSDADWNEEQLLRDARDRAQKLIASLIAQRQELDRFSLQIAPERLAQGQKAFSDAISSTQKTLQEIDRALQNSAHVGASNSPAST